MDCSGMYCTRAGKDFSDTKVAYVFQYRSNFEEDSQFYATRKLDDEFLVPVLHIIDVSILTIWRLTTHIWVVPHR